MKRLFTRLIPLSFFLCIADAAPVLAQDGAAQDNAKKYTMIVQQVEELQRQMEQMNRQHAAEMKALKTELARLRGGETTDSDAPVASATETIPANKTEQESLYDTIKTTMQKPLEKDGLVKGLDLDASVVIDTYYYHDDTEEGMAHVKEELRGFGHSHGGEEDEHHHSEIENGFNLRHIELGLSAAVDPFFRAFTTLAIEDGNSEIEEAVIQTTALPWHLTLSGGKFFSGIGRVNRQHSHNWDFLDQPLVYELLFGPHGLQEKGVQLTWLAPTSFYLLFGAEASNGDNEKMFQKVDAEQLPDKDAPRLWTGFIKFAPNLGDSHAMQFGVSYATGFHQEAHDGDEDGNNDHWLHGRSDLWGADFIYKYDAKKTCGHGDFVLQAEYLNRKKDLDVEQHDLVPLFTGRDKVDHQDGYYLQALYGFLPRWRAGVRWEQVGLINEIDFPDLAEEDYGPSSRATAMLDWKLSEFSLVRLQSAWGDFKTEDGDEKAWEFALQWQVTFGKHAAHDF